MSGRPVVLLPANVLVSRFRLSGLPISHSKALGRDDLLLIGFENGAGALDYGGEAKCAGESVDFDPGGTQLHQTISPRSEPSVSKYSLEVVSSRHLLPAKC